MPEKTTQGDTTVTGSFRKLRYVEYFLAIVAGIFLINFAWSWQVPPPGPNPARRILDIIGIVLGALLILVNFLRFSKAIRRDARNYIIFRSDTGSLRVLTSAIEEALRHTARSLPEVYDVRVRLSLDPQTGIPAAAEVDARIRDLTNIIAIHDTLSRVLAERYQQIIPGAPPLELHLTIKPHVRPPSKPKPAKTVPPEEDETKAIRAPLYPIPDER